MASGTIKGNNTTVELPLTNVSLKLSSEQGRLVIAITDDGSITTNHPNQIIIASNYIRVFMSNGSSHDIT